MHITRPDTKRWRSPGECAEKKTGLFAWIGRFLAASVLVAGVSACNSSASFQRAAKEAVLGRPVVNELPFKVQLLARAQDRVLHDMINAAAFSPDGKYVAIGSMHAYHLVIWDIENRRTVRQIPLPSGTERDSLFWSADGRFLTTYNQGAVWVFEPFSGELLQKFVGIEIGPGGPRSLSLNQSGSQLVVAFEDAKHTRPNLAVFDTATWQMKTFETRKKFYLQKVFWAKSKVILEASDRTRDKFLSVLDPASGEISGRLVITSPVNPAYEGSLSIELDALCSNADGTRMAVTYQHPHEIDRTLKIINLQTLMLEKTIPMLREDAIEGCQFSADGSYLFLQNLLGPIRVVDTSSYKKIGSIPHKVSNGGLAVSRDGKRLAIGQVDELLIYSIN